MKTIMKLFFGILVLILLFSSLALIVYTGVLYAPIGKEKNLQKTFTWNYPINKDGSICIDNLNCNTTIHVWDKGETEYHLTIDARTRTDRGADILDKFFTYLKFANTPDSVSFRVHLWESRFEILNRMIIKLEGGNRIALSRLSMKGELWIPSGCNFVLKSKYSRIDMDDFAGQLTIDLNNGHLYGGNLKCKTRIVDHYSTIRFKDIKDLSADLHKTNLEATNTGDLRINSKYTMVKILCSGKLEINSYHDKYTIPKTNDITFTSKYSELKTDSSGQLKIDSYKGTFVFGDVKDVKIDSKYDDFQLGTMGDISVSSAYKSKLVARTVRSLNINESKYGDYRIDKIKDSFTATDGYKDKFIILTTTVDLKLVNVNGKYIEASIGLLKSTDYRFNLITSNSKLDIDESLLKSKVKIEGSKLKYDVMSSTEREVIPLIEVNGYNMLIKIIEI